MLRGSIKMLIDALLGEQMTWNMPLLLVLIGIGILYGLFVNMKVSCRQLFFFFLSIGLFYLMMGSPLTTLSHLSFSLHMIQMSILYFIIPPLFLLGIPNSFFQRWKHTPLAHLMGKSIISPNLSLMIFAVLFLMYHLPITLTFFSQLPFIHYGYIYLLFILSLRMWWPFVSPDLKQRLTEGRRKKYASLSGILLMPACLLFIISAFINETNNPLLTELMAHLCIPSSSISIAILPAPFNTNYDQAMAGVIMLGIHKASLLATNRLKNEKESPKIVKYEHH